MKNGFAYIFLHLTGRQGAKGNYSAQTRVAILVDAIDDVTPASLSQCYLTALTARGKADEIVVMLDRVHVNGINSPQVVATVLRLGKEG